MNALRAGISPAFLLLSASSLWGIATVLSKSLLSTIEPVPLLFVQLCASCLLLLPLCFMLGRRIRLNKLMLPAALLGVLNPGISYTFSMMALDRIPASASSIFWATEPLLILLLGALFLKERITTKTMAVIATGFAGAILVTGILTGSIEQFSDLVGSGYMAIAVFLCAIYTVVSRKLSTEFDPLALVAVQQLAGLGWAAALLWITVGIQGTPGLSEVPGREILYAGLTGLLYYALAYWLYMAALGRVSAALAGASFNVIPVVAIVTAYVFLGERLSASQLVGVALILVSGTLLVWFTRKSEVEQV